MALRRRVADVFWAFMYWYFFGGGAGGINAGVLTPAAVEELFGGGAGGINAGALTPATVEELSDRVAIVTEDPARAEAAQSILEDLRKDVVAFVPKSRLRWIS
jgi:hypothetical protein